jgi:hypothetical protein
MKQSNRAERVTDYMRDGNKTDAFYGLLIKQQAHTTLALSLSLSGGAVIRSALQAAALDMFIYVCWNSLEYQ